MIHEMKLLKEPFNNIKNGTKTVEFRLYDEKRKKIRIGDKIIFYKLPELKEKLIVKVLDLYKEPNFEELFKNVFYSQEEIDRHIKKIYTIYSKEQEEKYGVLGIKIQLQEENK